MITLILAVSPALDSRKYRKYLIAAAVTLNSCNGLAKGRFQHENEGRPSCCL
jgi:hypothetical protein